MSQENVEIARRWIEAWNRRDVEGLTELTEPDFELKSLFVPIEGDFFRGYAALHAYFEAVDEAYEHLLSVPEEFIDAGAAVVVVTHLDWRGKGSGAHGETPVVVTFWLRAGKVFREETFMDRAEALEAVGLSE
jgi:ketosteroid isomerase-like protein